MNDIIIIPKEGMLPEAHWKQNGPPIRIILHDTAGPNLRGAEETLIQRGLGYHIMIDRDGSVSQYYNLLDAVNHARGNNKNTIGISLVGGAGTPLEEIQIANLIRVMQQIKIQLPSVVEFSSHKEVDAALPDPSGKIDPEFNDFEGTMNRIANETKLKRYTP